MGGVKHFTSTAICGILIFTVANVLSPHLDDAALSCWHQLELPDSQVTTVFAGIPDHGTPSAWDKLTGQTDARAVMALRRSENERALRDVPATIVNLDYLDRPYTSEPRDVVEMADAVESTSNTDASFIAAAGIGRYLRHHPDHVTTRDIGLELLGRGREITFYADLPYMLPARNFRDWPSRLSSERIKRALDLSVTIEPHELTPQEQQRKQAAVRAYSSQWKMVNALALGALKKPAAYQWEVLIRPS
jgi:LmbE family N-acetylglucosaminyl deacetylase